MDLTESRNPLPPRCCGPNFQRCHPFRKIVGLSIGQGVVFLGVGVVYRQELLRFSVREPQVLRDDLFPFGTDIGTEQLYIGFTNLWLMLRYCLLAE